MKIAVVPNLTKEAAQTCTDEVLSILGRCGCETVLKTDLFTAHGIYQERVEDSLRACDVFIAIGGILVASRGSSAQVMCCDNYLMPSLAAVFVGRTVGGAEKPNALGTMIGAMLVSTLENGLTICAVPFYVLPAVKGAVLALALIAAYASKKED